MAGAANSKMMSEEFMTKDMLMKQKFILDVLRKMWEPLDAEEYEKMGEKFDFEEKMFFKFDKSMEDFKKSWFEGMILPRGQYYTLFNRYLKFQTEGLTKMLYFAKDWESFKQISIWARKNINEGLFATALTIAVMRRDDMKYIALPSLHEIYPQMFFNETLIAKAEQFDMDMWQMEEGKQMKDMSKDFKQSFMKKWGSWNMEKKRWELIWNEVEDKKVMRKEFAEYAKDKANMDLLKDLKMFWIKADYTDFIDMKNEESKLAYFTEDADWNMYWFYLSMKYASFMKADEMDFEMERRGEWWMFNMQQMLARYYQERLSQGMGKIDNFCWETDFEMGYSPRLSLPNGQSFSERPNNCTMFKDENWEMFQYLEDWERRIMDIIEYGQYTTAEGMKIDMKKPEALEMICNMLQGNMDSVDRKFLGTWMTYARFAASGNDFWRYNSQKMDLEPSVLLNNATAMRDPAFYSIMKKMIDFSKKFYYQLGAYKREELMFEGVKINNIDIDELRTCFSWVDSDLSALMDSKYMRKDKDGKFDMKAMLLARRVALDYKKFIVNIDLDSDKPRDAVIRMFMGPKYDEAGRPMEFNLNRENFMLLNKMYVKLNAGKNDIKISSDDFYYTRKGRFTMTEMYKKVMLALEGKTQLSVEQFQYDPTAFPDRLVLPMGWVDGMPMQFFAIVTKFDPRKDFDAKKAYDQNLDSNSFRFPLDRPIEEISFWMPNMFMKDVKIYHDEEMKDMKCFEEKFFQMKL